MRPPTDLNYFPLNYGDARLRFNSQVDQLNLECERGQWKVPSRTDDDLFVDYAYFPALEEKRKLFVISSGVHGLEAYAGSAIQSLFLQEYVSQLDRRSTAILLIHSLNPFGFKHHRRGTENHVNLNRNCSADDHLFRIDNSRSVELSRRFVPKVPVDGPVSEMVQRLKRENDRIFFDDVNLDDFIKQVGMGQYQDPQGLEFGGFEFEPQIQAVAGKLRELMPAFDDVVLFDLHTGLGERARLHLLTGDLEGCVHPELFRLLFKPSDDHQIYDFTAAESEGFYTTHGAFNNIFAELAKPQQRICALTLEFGTLGHSQEDVIEGIDRWLLEHQGTHFGFKNAELEQKILGRYLEKFCPQDPLWREKILSVSREFFLRVFLRSGELRQD